MQGDVGQIGAMVVEQLRKTEGEQFGKEEDQKKEENQRGKRVTLDEKYFRRVNAFEGEIGKFRGWLFDLTVAI